MKKLLIFAKNPARSTNLNKKQDNLFYKYVKQETTFAINKQECSQPFP